MRVYCRTALLMPFELMLRLTRESTSSQPVVIGKTMCLLIAIVFICQFGAKLQQKSEYTKSLSKKQINFLTTISLKWMDVLLDY